MDRVFIIGGGNSLSGFDFSRLKNETTIAINGSCFYVPNVNHVIWSDIDFWPKHRERLQKECEDAELWTSDAVWVLPPYKGTKPYRRMDTHQTGTQNPEEKLHLYGGKGTYLTGVLALSFAIAKGFGPIYMLGYDCKNIDGKNHFHDHSRPKDAFSHSMKLYEPLKNENIINLGPDSDLETFPKKSIDEVLNDNNNDCKQGASEDFRPVHCVNNAD